VSITKDIAQKQDLFFRILKDIQEEAVVIALSERKESNTLEDTLYNATYHALYSFLELIDGYAADEIKLDLIDRESGEPMRKSIELHDRCAAYLRYQKD